MKQRQTKAYLVRLNLNDPEDRTVAERLNHRQGLTVTKFFVHAVLADRESNWRESDRDFLRQVIREELSRMAVQAIAALAKAPQLAMPSMDTPVQGEVSEEAQEFMKLLGFDG